MTPATGQTNDTNVRDSGQKEWRRPVLRKLSIEATAGSTSKTGSANSDGGGTPKTADATGQFS
jgi:hypothetical protein